MSSIIKFGVINYNLDPTRYVALSCKYVTRGCTTWLENARLCLESRSFLNAESFTASHQTATFNGHIFNAEPVMI